MDEGKRSGNRPDPETRVSQHELPVRILPPDPPATAAAEHTSCTGHTSPTVKLEHKAQI